MRDADPSPGLDAVESAILPSLAALLDGLLESAALARPGHDAEAYAAELRALAGELESLTRQVESLRDAPPQESGRAAA